MYAKLDAAIAAARQKEEERAPEVRAAEQAEQSASVPEEDSIDRAMRYEADRIEALEAVIFELIAAQEMREDNSRFKQRRENSRFRNPAKAKEITDRHEAWKVRNFRAWNAARAAIAMRESARKESHE
jgi:hypothetical protein